MTRMVDLDQLVALSDARYRREQQSIQRILAEETRLRSALKQLDDQMRDSRGNGNLEQRTLGADMLWQGWIGRKKTELNQQLARLMVIKEQSLVQVRKAYGKLLVSEQMHTDARAVQKKKRGKAALDQAIEISLFLE